MAKRYYKTSSGPFGSIIGLLMIVLFFFVLFKISAFVFSLLWYVAPILLIVTLVMDHKIVTNYLEWVVGKFKTNPLFAVALSLLTVLGFPIVAGYLFSKLMVKRKITKMTQQFEKNTKGEFVDYEEVDSQPLELDELPPRQKQKAQNKYDDLFE